MHQHLDGTLRHATRLIVGLGLVLSGVILLVHRASIFSVFALWPLFVVGLGLVKVLGACCARQRHAGAWLLALGLWFSLSEFTSVGYHGTWPLMLVAAGGLVAWDALAEPGSCARCAEGRHAR
jgi:hypothetical protein